MSPLISSTSVFPSQTYLLKFGSIYLDIYWKFPLGMSYCAFTFTKCRLTNFYYTYVPSFLYSLSHLVLASSHQSESRNFSLILTVISHSRVVDSVRYRLQNLALLSIFGVIALFQIQIMSFYGLLLRASFPNSRVPNSNLPVTLLPKLRPSQK